MGCTDVVDAAVGYGDTEGDAVGWPDDVGTVVGFGETEGSTEGDGVGSCTGVKLGKKLIVGCNDTDGTYDGTSDGVVVGVNVGNVDGNPVGVSPVISTY